MNRFASLLLAATLLSCTAVAADAATLKPAATVADGQILLGDLFDGLSPDVATRVVMTAPAPGRRTALDGAALTRIAAANGVDWRAMVGADRISIDRSAVEITNAVIQDSVRDAVQAAGAGDGVQVQMDNRTLSLLLPVGNDASVRVENLAYDSKRARWTADLVAPANGPEMLRQSVSGRAVDMVELPVLARRMAPGEVIGEADITYIQQPRDRVQAGSVTDVSEMIGKSLRRAVSPNQAVNGRDVRDPVVVNKGQLVTIVLQSEIMTLTASGKALSDGSEGELVRIVNTSSSRVIEAIVAGPNLVTVRPAGQIATVSHSAGMPKKAVR